MKKFKLIYALSIMVMFGIANTAYSQITVIASSSRSTDTITGPSGTVGSATFCTGDSIQLTVSYTGIDHVQWTSNPVSTIPQTFTVWVKPNALTNYYVYVYNGPLPSNYVGVITVTALPTALPLSQTVTANGVVGKTGHYCQATTGTVFGLNGSQTNNKYYLQIDGTSTSVDSLTGSGTSMNFPAITSGNYQVLVKNPMQCTTKIR